MDKDMHYCAVKVLAQAAGFTPDESQVIAYASQYVDDAVEHKAMRINFQEKVPDFIARYPRYNDNWFDPVCTAHRGIGLVSVVLNPEIQRKVLALYYFEDLRLREIAEAFGLTESRICQIHAQAIQTIKTYLRRFDPCFA